MCKQATQATVEPSCLTTCYIVTQLPVYMHVVSRLQAASKHADSYKLPAFAHNVVVFAIERADPCG